MEHFKTKIISLLVLVPVHSREEKRCVPDRKPDGEAWVEPDWPMDHNVSDTVTYTIETR